MLVTAVVALMQFLLDYCTASTATMSRIIVGCVVLALFLHGGGGTTGRIFVISGKVRDRSWSTCMISVPSAYVRRL